MLLPGGRRNSNLSSTQRSQITRSELWDPNNSHSSQRGDVSSPTSERVFKKDNLLKVTWDTLAKSRKEDGIPEDVEFDGEEPLTTDRLLLSEHDDEAPSRKRSSVHFPPGLFSSHIQNSPPPESPRTLWKKDSMDAESNSRRDTPNLASKGCDSPSILPKIIIED
jgi:hypothetical protein